MSNWKKVEQPTGPASLDGGGIDAPDEKKPAEITKDGKFNTADAQPSLGLSPEDAAFLDEAAAALLREEEFDAENEMKIPVTVNAPVEEEEDVDLEKSEGAEVPPEQEGPVGAPSRKRYTRRGRRKGKYRFAAPLGLAVTLLAIVGIVATGSFIVDKIRSNNDTTALKQELFYQMEPLMLYTPTAFTSAVNSSQEALIRAALYKVLWQENIRMRQVGTEESKYKMDNVGRYIVPLSDVDAAYSDLFGKAAKFNYKTFGSETGDYYTFLYDKENACYHVPSSAMNTDNFSYQPVIDTVTKAGDQITVRVGYVNVKDIKPDKNGVDIITPAVATYFQLYQVQEMQDGKFIILSVKDDGKKK